MAASEFRWYQSLNFKLGLLFVVLTLALGAAAIGIGRQLLHERLVQEAYRHQLESARRLGARIGRLAHEAQLLAASVATLAAGAQGGPASVGPFVPQLVAGAGYSVAGLGLWPEPRAGEPRASLYWLRGDDGALRARYDYNDPQAVPYWREKWYTPARLASGPRCYWTPAYVEPLSRRPTVTCSLAIRAGSELRGVVSADLALAQLGALLGDADDGYSLLVDAHEQVLAVSPGASALLQGLGRPTPTLAELAQHHAAYNPLALAVHERIAGLARAPAEAQGLRALREATRDLSEREAQLALAQLAAPTTNDEPDGKALGLVDDPVSGERMQALVLTLDNGWQLLRLTPRRSGFAAADLLYSRAVGVIGIAVTLCLGLVYLILLRTVVLPLRQMLSQFEATERVEDLLRSSLDATRRNEIGQIAAWHNERIRQLGEMMERTIATNSHLVIEAGARREAETALTRLQERAALTLQAITDGVITTDDKGMVEEMNTAAEDLTGHTLRDARGRSFGAVFVGRTLGTQGELLGNLAETAIQRGTRLEYPQGIVLSGFGGSRRTVSLMITPVRTRHNRVIGAVAVFRPVEAAGAALPAPERTQPDPLTGLPTRVACDRRLRVLIDAAKLSQKRHSAVLVDLDNFRRVVDSGGQPAADRVLSQVGELLTSKAAGIGEVFRLVADDFVIVLENFDADRARAFADALREALAGTRLYWESRMFTVTGSFGVVEFGSDVALPGEVLRRADDACASAKRAGRNTVKVFDPSMNRAGEAVEDSQWVRRIRAGLDRDLFHLTTQYIQPSADHQAEGPAFELFVALEDEEGFWATPSAFMPAAERHHLVPEIDRWVIRHAFAHFARHPDTLARIAFASINVSGQTLVESSTIDLVAQLLEQNPAITPSKLCFEVREDSILDHPHAARAFFDTIRGLGCRLAIDHFHSHRGAELELLRALPTDFVKVHGQEFRGIGADAVEQLVGETTIRLARTLHRRVIASSLDDAPQVEAWRRLGVDYLQGFALAKPSPVVFVPPPGTAGAR